MKTFQKLFAVAALLGLAQGALAQDVPDYIRSAVDSAARSDDMRARDPNRLPAQVLALSGIEPGDTVVEFAGFGHYYSTLLSEIVGAEGQVHIYDLPYTGRFGGPGAIEFVAEHANTSYHLGDYNSLALPDDVDVVFNVLYYHDLMLNDIDAGALNRKIYQALKPGGVFLIVDHNARPGSGTEDTETLHRIDPEVIKAEVQAAGFELAEESNMLARGEDDYSQGPFAEGMRGMTDRSVFKFVKPE